MKASKQMGFLTIKQNLNMKKNIFISTALAMVTLASCQQENLGGNDAVLDGFRVSAEETKAVLDGVHVVFKEGDAIDVYTDNQTSPAIYAYNPTTDMFEATGTVAEGEQYTVIYPSQGNESSSIINIPYRQISSNKTCLYMAGKSNTKEVNLKHLVGLWEIDLLPEYDGQKIVRAALSFTKPHFVNGNFEINWEDYSLKYVDGADGSRIMAAEIKATMSADTPYKIYFALPEGTYDGGFKFVADMSDGTAMTKRSTSTINIKRGQITKVKNDVDYVVFDSGAGTEADPYILKTAEHWNNMVVKINNDAENYASAYYKLANDIDFENKAVKPINTFKGVIDGSNFTLKNAKIGDGTASHQAFFYLLNGTVKNLKFDNITVTGGGATGAASSAAVITAGQKSLEFTIHNCHVTNSTITSGDGGSYAGGLVGRCDNNAATITDCSVSNSIIITGKENAGGIVALFGKEGTLTNVLSSGNTVKAETGGTTGGVVGSFASGTLINATSKDNTVISGNGNNAGGVVGSLGSGSFTDVKSSGNTVSGKSYVGGVVGTMAAASIINVISTDNVALVQTASCGGVLGVCTSADGKIINIYSKGNTVKCPNHSNAPYLGLIVGANKSDYTYAVANTLTLTGIADYVFDITKDETKTFAGAIGIVMGYEDKSVIDSGYYFKDCQYLYDAKFYAAKGTKYASTNALRFAVGVLQSTGTADTKAGKEKGFVAKTATELTDVSVLTALNTWVENNKETYPSLKSWTADENNYPVLILSETSTSGVKSLNVVESNY